MLGFIHTKLFCTLSLFRPHTIPLPSDALFQSMSFVANYLKKANLSVNQHARTKKKLWMEMKQRAGMCARNTESEKECARPKRREKKCAFAQALIISSLIEYSDLFCMFRLLALQ